METFQSKTHYLGQRVPRHLAVERDAHSLHDPIVFDRSVEGGLHRLGGGSGHHQLSVLCDNLSVGDLHDAELDLLNDPLLDGRQVELLQVISDVRRV